MSGYMRPVDPTWLDSWRNHLNRVPKSKEPGTDYGCPIGTPLLCAADGVVSDANYDDVVPATGLYVTVRLNDGRMVRYLHMSRVDAAVGQLVSYGQMLGLSGATGYGSWDWSNDGTTQGAHTHMTLWPSWTYSVGPNAKTLDPEAHMGATPADQDSRPFNPQEAQEEAMALRIITSPYYRSAGQQVVHNGLVATSISNAEALDLRQGGVPSHDYDEEYKFNNELNRVWNLGGAFAQGMVDEFGERLHK